ncbi:MAG: pyruvate kinase, partial [Anaerolineales bacterium]|nr:pyruvate kinase [Anaerolineales bacterium]
MPPGTSDRRAKILVTLGPSCLTVDSIKELVEAGADGVRLNFSHGAPSEHAELIRRVRELSEQLEAPIAIVQDLQGPKLRTASNANGEPIRLQSGQSIVITTEPGESTPELIHVDYDPLPRDVDQGDRILIDDGRIELVTRTTTDTEGHAEVVVGGDLLGHKGLNLPGVRLSAPSLTEKDKSDLKFGLEHGVDMIAMSFVRKGEDIAEVDRLVAEYTDGDLPTPVIGKLERQEALDNLEAILKESDGVMVARGDLGVEVAAERVPSLQKRIISSANAHDRLVITATQMLESMIRNPRPTRAEASDVANAV